MVDDCINARAAPSRSAGRTQPLGAEHRRNGAGRATNGRESGDGGRVAKVTNGAQWVRRGLHLSLGVSRQYGELDDSGPLNSDTGRRPAPGLFVGWTVSDRRSGPTDGGKARSSLYDDRIVQDAAMSEAAGQEQTGAGPRVDQIGTVGPGDLGIVAVVNDEQRLRSFGGVRQHPQSRPRH